ncbi:hypothetical protein COU59_03140 [Candidatus Pacearchaeota archaeon CG10_big_fil_rev_8_21_14_0_10_34_12]|nr:MAG: hypothetical protein COU59_03140 [Candidatus Pacearchaeota archaeon CG10_big_fil_rev_8_21_14_0_10_34_12]
MPLEKHHKITIGGFSFVLIILLSMGVFMYLFYMKIEVNYQNLDQKISDLQTDTQTKINELSDSIIETNNLVNTEVGSLNKELSTLKASVGEDFSGIIETVVKSVVTIKTDSAQGTGFIISNEGYVVTNAHVLADSNGYLAGNIRAITYNEGTKNAEFIGFDSDFDIALIKISGSYDSLELANSNDIKVGQKVAAIGNPLGLGFSSTQGIISATEREGPNGINAYIQTDTPINPGNSGGPLINTEGKVVGINNFKISSAEGLGFALESNYIKEAINDISQEQLNQTLIN